MKKNVAFVVKDDKRMGQAEARRKNIPSPLEPAVRSLLTEDRARRINQAYGLAGKDWWKRDDRQRLSRWPRTRATNLFEYLTTRLEDECKDDTEAHFIFERETFTLVIQKRLIIRLKKSNGHGVGSNSTTQTELDGCDLPGNLPGNPGLQKVESVYRLHVTETASGGITVLARSGDRRLGSDARAGSGGRQAFRADTRNDLSLILIG